MKLFNLHSYLKEIKRKKNVLILFILIALLQISLYTLPKNIKESLTLKIDKPNLLTIFISNYIHKDINHLMNNLGLYIILIFFIIAFEKDKKILYLMAISNFIILPIVSSVANILIFPAIGINPNELYGFSAIACSFLSLFYYSCLKFLYFRFNKGMNGFSFFFLLLCLLYFILLLFKDNISILLLTLLTATIILLIIFIKYDFKAVLFFFASILIVLIFFLISQGVLKVIIVGNTFTNTLSHYIGLLFGMFTPLVYNFLLKFKRAS